MTEKRSRQQFVAFITAAFSIIIGIVYLFLITVLDSRGPMIPPPHEALGEEGIVFDAFVEEVQQPS